jgi:hypothetical protein
MRTSLEKLKKYGKEKLKLNHPLTPGILKWIGSKKFLRACLERRNRKHRNRKNAGK